MRATRGRGPRRAAVGALVLAAAWPSVGCRPKSRPLPPADARADGASGGSPSGNGADSVDTIVGAIERAEDERRPSDIPDAWQTSNDPLVRRRSIRALARIAESPLDAVLGASLVRALGDEDPEVVGWAAYGLGWACKGHEDDHVKVLAARAVTLAGPAEDEDARPEGAADARDRLSPRASIARALGRCGGPLAEGVLAGFLRASVAPAAFDLADEREREEVAYALGAIAGRHALTDETMGVLLDVAGRGGASDDPPRPRSAVSGAALYPIGRLDHVPEAWTARVLEVSRRVIESSEASPTRGFAVRALEKAGPEAIPVLGRAVSRADLTPPERAEAARALGRLGVAGRAAEGAALGRLLEDRARFDATALHGDDFNVLLAVIEALGQDAPRSADASLYVLSGVKLAAGEGAGLARRTVAIRCAAAAALARAAYDAPALATCDPDPEGVAGQRARLAALVRRPLTGERRRAFKTLASSPHPVVREAALEAVPQHPELDDLGRALLVDALDAPEPGVVATAAQSIVQHPEHVLTLAAAERRAGLDPRARPPTSTPALELPPDVAASLGRALARAWREDAVETRTLLLDASVAVKLPEAHAAAARACLDPNVTVREHAARALRALGAPAASCPLPAAAKPAPASANGTPPPPIPKAGAYPPLAHPVRVTFAIDGLALGIVFEPDLSPLAAARFVALARAGFYRGVVVHRVVPGYVVQFGDPGGDGYGGSGTLLRCETSPVPFGALDVGVALAGRDTGSSQVFVTLARYPKLDGDYARVGRALGDWAAVAEGDVVQGVSVDAAEQ